MVFHLDIAVEWINNEEKSAKGCRNITVTVIINKVKTSVIIVYNI
jgi:hypothetical protein